MSTRRNFLKSTAAVAATLATSVVRANAGDMPGITDTEIKIGQTMPYSGPASSYGVIGKAETAYFKMINEMGGVNGRKLNLISVDDGYSPPKTIEQIRRLVEQEKVAFIFQSVGTPTNAAIRSYLNENKVPQLFTATGASMFSDPEHFPWTIEFNPTYQTEAKIYAKHIIQTKPDAKIGVFYQNDAFGKDHLIGLKEGLGADHVSMVVKEVSYEVSEPSIDSQIVTLQGSGADVLLIAATPKAAAQAIRKSSDLGWTARRYIANVSLSITSVLKPAGLEKSKGLISATYAKDANDPRWKDDAGLKEFSTFVEKYMSPVDFGDLNTAYGFTASQTLIHVLQRCGNDLSRTNIMKQAADIKDLQLPMLLPGIKLNTAADNFRVIRQMQLATFSGESWDLFGDVIST